MLETIMIVLFVLWILGLVAIPLAGNAIHLLLVVILVLFALKLYRSGPGPRWF